MWAEINLAYKEFQLEDLQKIEAQLGKVFECEVYEDPGEEGQQYEKERYMKYMNGLRKLKYNQTAVVPIDMLYKFLPCEVRQIPRLATEIESRHTASRFNEKVQVITPGPALSAFTEVELLEDCCTDRLAGRIGEGWRILAICVQPDQRRPDYILGNTKSMDFVNPPEKLELEPTPVMEVTLRDDGWDIARQQDTSDHKVDDIPF